MAEVTYAGPGGQIHNGCAVINEGAKPDIEDGWTPVLPSTPVRVDGGTFIAPAVAKGEPVTNDGGHATIYQPAHGRKVEPGHVSNVEVRVTPSPARVREVPAPTPPVVRTPEELRAPPPTIPNPDATILPQSGATITANTDVSIGGGGPQEGHEKPARMDHVSFGGTGRTIRR